MRPIIRSFVLAAVSASATTAFAFDRVTVNVPFNFETHGKTLQPGIYRVDPASIYAMEVSYNRANGSWHPHLHIVFDAPWPTSGIARSRFVRLKRLLEFSWLRTTSPEARRTYRRNEFERWMKESAQHVAGSDYNKRFRRVVDLRAVKGEDAVYELVKYVSKTNRFIDLPGAVATFLRAIRGVRVLQTFGTFYNFNSKIEAPITKEDIDAAAAAGFDTKVSPGAAAFLRCDCGKNKFERLGVYAMHDVEMGEDGRWLLRLTRGRQGNCRGSSLTYGGISWDSSNAR